MNKLCGVFSSWMETRKYHNETKTSQKIKENRVLRYIPPSAWKHPWPLDLVTLGRTQVFHSYLYIHHMSYLFSSSAVFISLPSFFDVLKRGSNLSFQEDEMKSYALYMNRIFRWKYNNRFCAVTASIMRQIYLFIYLFIFFFSCDR